MATIKRTFTFDEATSIRLDRTAYRLSKPKSEVVREAIRVYSEQIGLLTEDERLRMLATFDRVVPSIPERPVEDVETELEEVRRARRGGGRQSEGESGE
jgi:predicted DNA-binding protein